MFGSFETIDLRVGFAHLIVLPGQSVENAIDTHKNMFKSHDWEYVVLQSYQIVELGKALPNAEYYRCKLRAKFSYLDDLKKFIVLLQIGRAKKKACIFQFNDISDFEYMKKYQKNTGSFDIEELLRILRANALYFEDVYEVYDENSPKLIDCHRMLTELDNETR